MRFWNGGKRSFHQTTGNCFMALETHHLLECRKPIPSRGKGGFCDKERNEQKPSLWGKSVLGKGRPHTLQTSWGHQPLSGCGDCPSQCHVSKVFLQPAGLFHSPSGVSDQHHIQTWELQRCRHKAGSLPGLRTGARPEASPLWSRQKFCSMSGTIQLCL